MAKIPTTGQAHEFHYRPGTDPFGPGPWRLVNTESDPGSLDPNELQWGENIRRQGKGIRSRSGMIEKLDLGVAAGGIMYFGALPADNPRTRIWMSTLGAYGGSTLTGSGLMHYDPSEVIAHQHHSHYFRAADYQMPIAKYGTRLFIGDKTTLREVIDLRGSYGIEAIVSIPTPPVTPVVDFPGFHIRCMLEFNGLLFIGLENINAPDSSKVVAWNGLSATNDLLAVRPPIAMGIWRDKLVVGFDATAAHARSRAKGAVPGTWTTHALAGFLTSTSGNAMAECGANLYIASGNNLIHKFDGTNLSLVRTIATAAVDGRGITALALHRGLLYYGWNNNVGSHASFLGRFDPDSSATDWIDAYRDITGASPNFQYLSSMISYRGQIYIGGRQAWVLATAVNDVKGTPLPIHDTGALTAADFRVMQMLRYP